MKSLLNGLRLEFLGYLLAGALTLLIAGIAMLHADSSREQRYAGIGKQAPDIVFEDQDGVFRLLSEFKGQALILAPIFTRCQETCPRLVDDLVRSLKPGAATKGARYRVLLFSFDPRDTVQALRAFQQAHRVPASWTLARARATEIQVLIHALGIRARAEKDGGFAHPDLLVLLTPALKTAAYLPGRSGPHTILAGLREASLGDARSGHRYLSAPYLLAFSVLGAFLTSLTFIQGANGFRSTGPGTSSSRKSDSDRRRRTP